MNEMIPEQTLKPRVVKLTPRNGIDIRRTLPHKNLRMIGAWCFVDHYGPTDQDDAMSVAAHPHVGLQTVSWLFSGLIEHRDSLGSIQKISPGALNIMTSGHGIAHSELSLDNSSLVHGVQLWTALPESDRDMPPLFEHHQDLPYYKDEALSIRLFVGELKGMKSPAKMYSALIGAEIDVESNVEVDIELQANFEYGVLLVAGDLTINGFENSFGELHYIPAGAVSMALQSRKGAKIVLLGGEPFQEKILMWWNFIGRTQEEIESMRLDWNQQTSRFPTFPDRIGGWIPAPELPNVRLFPRGNF
jgi:redox-sensitive bicupin YhaK (pirin superfamily)